MEPVVCYLMLKWGTRELSQQSFECGGGQRWMEPVVCYLMLRWGTRELSR